MHEVPECLLVCHVGASELCLGTMRQVGFVWISLSIPCCSMKPPVLWSLRYYPTWPGNKLVCQGFMDVGRKRETPGSATKDFVIPGIATSMSFVFVSSPPALALAGQCKGSRVTHTQVVGYVTEEEADFSC